MPATSFAPQPGLFASLGGRAGIEAIVNGLYDRLERDPELSRMFASHRAGERARLAEFFETIFGGEVRGARDVGMQRRHQHRFVSGTESARWLEHFDATMSALGIPEASHAEVMGMLRGPAARLVNAGAPRPILERALAAAAKGDRDAVAELVANHPALLNQRGRDGVTLLWTAARRGFLPTVSWLADAGADITIPGSAVHVKEVMVSPYCIARRFERQDVAEFLLERGAIVDVFSAAFLGDIPALNEHIAAGELEHQSPDEDFHPCTPLHYAVDGGWVEAVRLLLENGADAVTAGGRLLTSAANHDQLEIVHLLLHYGARAETAESLGVVGRDASIGALLVEHGFDLNRPIRGHETPLTMACRADKGEHPDTIVALLTLGADPNAPNGRGRTPLTIATSAGYHQTVEILRFAGAR